MQGIGGAIMFAVSLALLAHAFRGKDRGVAFGIWGAITGLAVAIGPLLGGALTSGLVMALDLLRQPPDRRRRAGHHAAQGRRVQGASTARRPDWVGFVIFTAALASLVYALIESNEQSFSSRRVIGCFVAAGVLLVLFVRRGADRHASRCSICSCSSCRRSPAALVAAFGLSASIFSLLLYLVLYIQDILGYSPFGTGLRLLVLSGGILVTSTIAGRLTSHVPSGSLDRSGPDDRRASGCC